MKNNDECQIVKTIVDYYDHRYNLYPKRSQELFRRIFSSNFSINITNIAKSGQLTFIQPFHLSTNL